MTEQEYRERDYALMKMIEEYHADNAEHELQIAINNKQISELEKNRHELWGEYSIKPTRKGVNLQGEEIK